MRKIGSVLAVLALTAAACSTTANTPTSTGETRTVQVDSGGDGSFNFFSFAFFPAAVTVHAGDTVKFDNAFTGEPHTVSLGSLVNDLLVASDEVKGKPTKELKAMDAAIPPLLPDGPGDAPQSVANPCFLATGAPPATDGCSETERQQVPFDGTQSFFNSGFLGPDVQFSVTLADDIAPGTYRYFCALHRQGMQGSITVVADDETIPSEADVEQERADALSKIETGLQPAVDAPQNDGIVAAGTASRDVQEAMVDEFLPNETSVPVGGTVTWAVFGDHTISFNAPTEAKLALTQAPDGAWHANEAAFTPSPPGPPPGEIHKKTAIDGGSFDGEAFVSSGIVLAFEPGKATYSVTFSTAGTYTYVCLIHPDMEGTVKVG